MNSALRGTAANVEVWERWERWPTDKTVQQLGDGSGDKLLSLSFPLSLPCQRAVLSRRAIRFLLDLLLALQQYCAPEV